MVEEEEKLRETIFTLGQYRMMDNSNEKKLEDISVDESEILNLIDESIKIIKSERPYEQLSYFN